MNSCQEEKCTAVKFDDEFTQPVREVFTISPDDGQAIRTKIGEIFGKFVKVPNEKADLELLKSLSKI